MKKYFLFFLFSFMIVGLLSSNSFAIGMGPPKVDLDFVPNLKTTLNYIVVNNQNQPLDIDIYVRGDLAEYITLSKTSAHLDGMSDTNFHAYLNLPANISSGLHDIRIGVIESSGGGGTVGAKAGVESLLYIHAPYTGKYIIASMFINNTKVDTPAKMIVKIENVGNTDISSLIVGLDILDSENKKIAALDKDVSSLSATQSKTFFFEWIPDTRGKYRAVAKINYDGDIKEISQEFTVGDIFIEIAKITTNDFRQGQIARINIELQNEWNEKVDGVWVDIEVPINSSYVSGESKAIMLDSYEKRSVDVFIDTKDIPLGLYNSTATVHFLDKTNEKTFIFEVKEEKNISFFFDGIMIYVFAIILIIVILFMGLIAWKRKRRSLY